MANRKFYVVWEGRAPGIYDSWEECKLQIEGYTGAKYKSFDSQEAATAAFRGSPSQHIGLITRIARAQTERQANLRAAQAVQNAIAVDGASSGNPGPIEYRGVRVSDGTELFRVGPLQGGTNNIAEYLALIHVLALLDKCGDHTTPVYSDSRTAQAWLRKGVCNTKITWSDYNEPLRRILERANAWRATHKIMNPVLKWDTDNWGEIPADFGRK